MNGPDLLAIAALYDASVGSKIVGFAVSVLFYFAIFAVVGLLFRGVDRRLRLRIGKSRGELCLECGAPLPENQRKGERLCKECRNARAARRKTQKPPVQ